LEYALLALRGPSNIEKKVRELQTSLYRQGCLVSARALPVMIPLCFLDSRHIPSKPGELRESLRRALGKAAPYLNSGSVAECDGFLYWNLSPRRELQRLRRSCQKAFPSVDTKQEDRRAAEQQELFPVARGFFLCSLQGHRGTTLPCLKVPEPLRFPAGAAFLLHVRTLGGHSGVSEPAASTDNGQSPWTALFWEKLEEIPLRKTRTDG
jgi:hypothetical protein